MKQVKNNPDYEKLPDDIKSLTNSSQINWHLKTNYYKVPVCSHCKENNTKWDNTLKSYRDFCSVECGSRAIKTNIKRNSAREKHTEQDKERSQEKRRLTLIEKYGENFTEVILNKAKETSIERYGVEYGLQNSEIRQKFTNTMVERHGVPYAMKSEELRETHKESMMTTHGVEYGLRSPEIRAKRKETMIKKYGTEHARLNTDINQKMRENSLEKYGCEWPSQEHINKDSLTLLENAGQLEMLLKTHNLTSLGAELNVDPTTISNYIKRHGIEYESNIRISEFENKIEKFLQENEIHYQKNIRTVISPYEIDFYLPEYNLGIECNGDYWHSDKFKSTKYHYNKWALSVKNKVRLIQVSESDYNTKTDIFHNMILSIIGKQPKGSGARLCHIEKISGKIAIPFLKTHHLQGSVNGEHYGAFNKGKLIAVMTIGYTRGSKLTRRKELKRWVTDNKTHPGLFSKTLAFVLQDKNITELVSFSMNDWFNGRVYEKTGFIKGKTHSPGYRYLWRGRLVHASNFTKAEIRKKFKEAESMLNEGATEKQIMDSLNVLRVWDAGKTEWIYKRNTK
jgi:hypothetical protein